MRDAVRGSSGSECDERFAPPPSRQPPAGATARCSARANRLPSVRACAHQLDGLVHHGRVGHDGGRPVATVKRLPAPPRRDQRRTFDGLTPSTGGRQNKRDFVAPRRPLRKSDSSPICQLRAQLSPSAGGVAKARRVNRNRPISQSSPLWTGGYSLASPKCRPLMYDDPMIFPGTPIIHVPLPPKVSAVKRVLIAVAAVVGFLAAAAAICQFFGWSPWERHGPG
jgi:hypothetical protein